MKIVSGLVKGYFNYVYNPLYDVSTGSLNRYRRLQEDCIGKIKLEKGDRVLCIGLGTGHEMARILAVNPRVHITGIDYSRTALEKAKQKALSLNIDVDLRLMDARSLDFTAGSFDKVICIHVMDFLDDHTKAAAEIIRVLKDGGQYAITFPSDKEGMGLGYKLLKDNVDYHLANSPGKVNAYIKSILQILVSLVYVPLLLRPQNKSYSFESLRALMSGVTGSNHIDIDENTIYHDLIVNGIK